VTTVAIVGASLAGMRCAQALRGAGFTGRVVVIGEESAPPYDRPPLSKELLLDPGAPVRLLGDLPDIELRAGVRAEAVDVSDHSVVLSRGRTVPYDHLVVATGAHARPSPWRVPGIRVLRTLGDARVLAGDIARGGPMVVIGAGFIGAEVAAAARSRGVDVTMVDPLAHPLARAVGPEAGRRLADLHARCGTRLRLSTGVEGVSGEPGAFEVQLADGDGVAAASVLVAIGAVPNDAWLRDSGIEVADGVVCDEHCRVRGAPGVYAAGDVAAVQHQRLGRPVRQEHWTSAVEQAECVAHGIAHPDDARPHRTLEYVWSDQYGMRIQVVGRPADAAFETVVADGRSPDRFVVLAGSQDGDLLGAVALDWPRATIECRRVLSSGEGHDAALERVQGLLTNAA
jgi:phthalate 3,4-dioxygenase ferredoxin reductase subunit